MDLKKIYSEYKELDQNDRFILNAFFDRLTLSDKKFQLEIHNIINESIVHEDNVQLLFGLNLAYRNGIDSSYNRLIAKLLTVTWHDEHEDLVNAIYLEDLKDDIFTDQLYLIATDPGSFRKYDDEMEPTLRKCIHALKIINSEKSNAYIEKLKSIKNSNVDMVLSMYNK
jgi:hypothetical protein